MTSVADKAKHLIALRDRAGTKAEALTAARVLAALLERHRLTEQSLEEEPADVDVDREPLYRWRRLAVWRRDLGDALCAHFGVAWWQRKRAVGGRRHVWSFMMCGRADDVALVRHMFAWLSVEGERLCRQECADSTTAYRRSWRLGFVEGIRLQIVHARVQTHAEAPKAALAIRSRSDTSWDRVHKLLGELPTKRWSGRPQMARPYAQGAQTGQAVHLGDRLSTGTGC